MTRTKRKAGRASLLAAAFLMHAVLGAGAASATQILAAADHAELNAEVSAEGVSRVALLGDRIARVIRAPGGYRVEHDPDSGDLYLHPLPAGQDGATSAESVALFVGSERGFTYRLTLTPVARGPAQILIRNPEIAAETHAVADREGDPRVRAIARLIRAVANREPLAGYAIEPGSEAGVPGLAVLEVWRGPRFSAWALEVGSDSPRDAAALAALLDEHIAAVWLAEPGTGPAARRLAVAVFEGDLR